MKDEIDDAEPSEAQRDARRLASPWARRRARLV
jgi:hypothetical protein